MLFLIRLWGAAPSNFLRKTCFRSRNCAARSTTQHSISERRPIGGPSVEIEDEDGNGTSPLLCSASPALGLVWTPNCDENQREITCRCL
jgi:hypothetical protein